MATSPLSITPEALKSLYADLTGQGYSHDVLVNAARQNYGIDLDQALKSSAPISYTDKINSGALETAAQPTYAEYQASLPAATSGALQASDTFTEDRYNPNDPASSRYIADPNAGQYVFDPVTGKPKLLSADQVYNNVEIPTFTDRTVYQGGGEDAGTFESAEQQRSAWQAEQDRRAALTPAQRAIEDARYTENLEGGNETRYNTVNIGGKDYTVAGDGSTLVRISDNQSGLGSKQTRYDMLDPVTGKITQEIGVEGPGLWKSFLTNPVTGLILGLALPGVGSAIGSALGATGAAAGALGSGVLNFGLQVAAGADPIDALKGAVLSAGAGFAGAQVSSMLPAELASAGKGAITQLITTGKLDPAALATSVGTSFATDALVAETGVDKATASKLVSAGLQALQGNELAALTSLAQAGLQSGLAGTGIKPQSSQDRAAFLDANASPLGLSALSPIAAEDDQIALLQRQNAANQALSDYTGPGNDLSREGLVSQLQKLGLTAEQAEGYAQQADQRINMSRVATDVMSRYSKIDPEFGTPQLDRQTAIGEMVAAGMSSERANELLNGVDAQNAIKLENKLGVQAAYQNLLTGKGSEDALRSAMTSAGYADADINDTVTRARGVIEGGKLTSGEQAQERASNLPDVRADIAAKSTFNEAYALAREKLGAGATFTWQGKPYSTATFQEDPKLGLVPVAGSGRGEAAGKTAEQEAAYENTRQQLAAAAAKPSGLISNIGSWLSNQMQLSSEAAQNYLKNNPNSPITQSVSTAYDAAGELLSNVGGGTALLLNNKPLADEFIRGGGELQKFGQSIGTGPQDTANFNDTMQLLSAAQGPQEKLAVLAGRILDGTSGLARQTVIELRQELPALFLGGAGARAAMVASGLIDTADTAGNAAIGAYDDAVRSGKTHEQALLDARKAGAAAGATEAAIQLTIGKLGDFAIGKMDNVAGKAAGKVLGEGVTEGGQEAGASAAVDLALGQSVDVNKALTQGIIGSAIGKSTALSTTPVDVATSDAASTFNNTLAQTGDIVQASTGSVTTAINNGLAPGTAVSTVIDAAAKSGGDMSAVITASINTGLSTALSSGADASTAVSTIVAGSVTASLNNGVDASMAVSATVGSSVKAGIVSGADASTVIASSVTAAVSTATQSGANATAVVVGSTSTAVSTAIANGVDAGTAISSAVDSATKAGANASTATASSITAAVAAGTDVNTAVTAATNANSNITANSTTNNNVTSTIATDTKTGVTSQTVVDSTSNTSTTTTTNNNVTSQVTTVGSTTTTTTSDINTGVTTQTTVDGTRSTDVTVDTNTNITTQVVTDTNTNTKVTVTWSPDGETKCTFTDPEGKETVFDDLDVGDPPKVDIVAPLEPVKAEVSPPKEPVKETKPKTSQSGSASGMMLPAMVGAAGAVDWLGPQFLKSKERGAYADPLAEFQALQQPLEQQDLLKQVQPELANVLTERGAMPYYTYGQEPSIDEVLGLPDEESSSYNESDYVPVFKSGGKVSPLNIQMMYAKGGHAREDFRDGKHVAGPGDGQSDDIPAWLADGEFVFPADVVSALGNGSTKAGTEKLYKMMHEIRGRARSKHPKDLPPPAHKSPLDYLKKGK
jgi:hypothetical protein